MKKILAGTTELRNRQRNRHLSDSVIAFILATTLVCFMGSVGLAFGGDESGVSDSKSVSVETAGDDAKPTDSKKADDDAKSADSKDEDSDAKPVDSKDEDSDAKPADSKDADSDAKPADSKDADGDAKPADSKDEDGDTKPANSKEKDSGEADTDTDPAKTEDADNGVKPDNPGKADGFGKALNTQDTDNEAEAGVPKADGIEAVPASVPEKIGDIEPKLGAAAKANNAKDVADAINSGVAKDIITATVSGNTVTVTTKKASTAAPHLAIDIPAGVTVVWKAQYINSDYVPVATQDDGHGGLFYSDEDTALIFLTGAGLFSIQSGADIRVTEGSASDADGVNAISSGIQYPSSAGGAILKGASVEVTGGNVSADTAGDGSTFYAIAIKYGSALLPVFSMSGGTVSASSTGKGGEGDHGVFGVLINDTDNAVVNITGGTISAKSEKSFMTFALWMLQGSNCKLNMSGGDLIVSSNADDVESTVAGLVAQGSGDVPVSMTLSGGRIYVKNENAIGVFVTGGNMKIDDGAAIFTVGSNAKSYMYEDAKLDISDIYANIQMTALSFANGTIAVGEELNPDPVTAPAKRTYKIFEWKSSDPSVATVDSKGKVTGVKKGVAVITALSRDFTDTTATFEITVIEADGDGNGDDNGDVGGNGDDNGDGGNGDGDDNGDSDGSNGDGDDDSDSGDSDSDTSGGDSDSTSSAPATGDESQVTLWVVMVALAAVMLTGIALYLRRTKKQDND
ncbi:MAG: Ig-like domain-containing protein [Clostridiales Family XIII bacterium]|jgi:hypothetical protein|nr:Ig-like domain-containing protein [Clostridiales Family XIII bacterium]